MTSLQANPRHNSAHPMEMFPGLRRWPASPLRNLFYTLLLNSLIASVFSLLAVLLNGNIAHWGNTLWPSLVFANCIGLLIHAVLLMVDK